MLLLRCEEHLCAGVHPCPGRECGGAHVSTALRCAVRPQRHELVGAVHILIALSRFLSF